MRFFVIFCCIKVLSLFQLNWIEIRILNLNLTLNLASMRNVKHYVTLEGNGFTLCNNHCFEHCADVWALDSSLLLSCLTYCAKWRSSFPKKKNSSLKWYFGKSYLLDLYNTSCKCSVAGRVRVLLTPKTVVTMHVFISK